MQWIARGLSWMETNFFRPSAVPSPNAPLKFGAHIWNAFTDWTSYLATMQAAERLGYDSLWTPDHMYPSMGAIEGDMFEAYTALAAVPLTTSTGS